MIHLLLEVFDRVFNRPTKEYTFIVAAIVLTAIFDLHDVLAGVLSGFIYYIYRYIVLSEKLTDEEWLLYLFFAIFFVPISLGLADYFGVGTGELSNVLVRSLFVAWLAGFSVTMLCFIGLHNLWEIFQWHGKSRRSRAPGADIRSRALGDKPTVSRQGTSTTGGSRPIKNRRQRKTKK